MSVKTDSEMTPSSLRNKEESSDFHPDIWSFTERDALREESIINILLNKRHITKSLKF